jgi:hypothetical protein
LVLHSVTGPFDNNRFSVVQQAVQDRGGDSAVVVENRGRLLERFVGRQNDGAALIALADDLEEQVSAVLVYRKIPQFIQEQ